MLVKVSVIMMILFAYLTPLHSFINSLSNLSNYHPSSSVETMPWRFTASNSNHVMRCSYALEFDIWYAIRYQKAVEKITSDHRNDLRLYELTKEEWNIAQELQDTVWVSELVRWLWHASLLSCKFSRIQQPSSCEGLLILLLWFWLWTISTHTSPTQHLVGQNQWQSM